MLHFKGSAIETDLFHHIFEGPPIGTNIFYHHCEGPAIWTPGFYNTCEGSAIGLHVFSNTFEGTKGRQFRWLSVEFCVWGRKTCDAVRAVSHFGALGLRKEGEYRTLVLSIRLASKRVTTVSHSEPGSSFFIFLPWSRSRCLFGRALGASPGIPPKRHERDVLTDQSKRHVS